MSDVEEARKTAQAFANHGRWRCFFGWHLWVTVYEGLPRRRGSVNYTFAFNWTCPRCGAQLNEADENVARWKSEQTAEEARKARLKALDVAAQGIVERLRGTGSSGQLALSDGGAGELSLTSNRD